MWYEPLECIKLKRQHFTGNSYKELKEMCEIFYSNGCLKQKSILVACKRYLEAFSWERKHFYYINEMRYLNFLWNIFILYQYAHYIFISRSAPKEQIQQKGKQKANRGLQKVRHFLIMYLKIERKLMCQKVNQDNAKLKEIYIVRYIHSNERK